jgi:hypothetical protein
MVLVKLGSDGCMGRRVERIDCGKRFIGNGEKKRTKKALNGPIEAWYNVFFF